MVIETFHDNNCWVYLSTTAVRCASLLEIGLYLRHLGIEAQLPPPEPELRSQLEKGYIAPFSERRHLSIEQLEDYCQSQFEKSLAQLDRQ